MSGLDPSTCTCSAKSWWWWRWWWWSIPCETFQ